MNYELHVDNDILRMNVSGLQMGFFGDCGGTGRKAKPLECEGLRDSIWIYQAMRKPPKPLSWNLPEFRWLALSKPWCWRDLKLKAAGIVGDSSSGPTT